MLFIAAVAIPKVAACAGGSLFADDQIFDLTLRAPIARLMRQAENVAEVGGSLELGSVTIPITCDKYGISRLRECRLASLKITVDLDHVSGTVFEGRQTLRLVTPCRLGGDHDRYTVLEYLVYKTYALIAEPALGVRLVRVRFQDSEKPARTEVAYAFFVEDIGHAARRKGLVWLEAESQSIANLDPEQLTLMDLFQYMVGNTDWSALTGPPGHRCCHNVAILGGEGIDLNTVLPFDFDQAGIVAPPYAAPAASLDIRRVTERAYRGFCIHNDLLPGAIAVFKERRPEVEALFSSEDLPYPQVRARALRYIDGFYDTINDPRRLDKGILRACR